MNTRCPVCGQPVDPATAPTSTYRSITYALRCPHCKERFDADPERFLSNASGGHEHARGGGSAPIRLERLFP
ncbi:MAG: YHS domain-containing protein [Chloroflexi bacterium]|nr:YHS domain-containing protein [Chloroflexota bacterium]